jgi:hypothetical protein
MGFCLCLSLSFNYVNLIGFMIFIVSTGLTVCYSFRLFIANCAPG